MGNKEIKAGKYGKLPDTVPIDKLHKFTHFSQDQIYDLLERFRHIANERAGRVSKEHEHDGATTEELEAEALASSPHLDIKTFGGLTYADFRALFMLPDSPVAEETFHLFDSNRDGLVDFRDFVVGMSMCYSGSLEEKLSFCFHIWDTQHLGYINKDEMRSLVRYLVRLGDVLIEDADTGQRVSLELDRSAVSREQKNKLAETDDVDEKVSKHRAHHARTEMVPRRDKGDEHRDGREGKDRSTDKHPRSHHGHPHSERLSRREPEREKDDKAERTASSRGQDLSPSPSTGRRHHSHLNSDEKKDRDDPLTASSRRPAEKRERSKARETAEINGREKSDPHKGEEDEHLATSRRQDREREREKDDSRATTPHVRRHRREADDADGVKENGDADARSRPTASSASHSQPATPSDSPRSRRTEDSESESDEADGGDRGRDATSRSTTDKSKKTRSRAHSRERRRHRDRDGARDLTKSGDLTRSTGRAQQDSTELARHVSQPEMKKEKERRPPKSSSSPPQSPSAAPPPPFTDSRGRSPLATSQQLTRSSSQQALQDLHHIGFGKLRDSPLWARKPDLGEFASSDQKIVLKTSRGDLDSQVDRFVDEIFLEAGCSDTCQLTFEQFKKWAAKTPLVTRFLAHFDVMLIDLMEEKEEAEYEEEERMKLDISWHCPKVDPSLVATMQLTDFEWLRKLGQGSYGDVWLVKYKDSDLLFAMKCIQKKRLVNDAMLAQARAEKKVLLKNTHPFIVHLYRTFRDDAHVYFLFEYVSGGELDHYFRANNRCFDLATAKFYAAELVLAIQYLHESLGAAHRDIKLNNVMVTSEGHLRLCDFGFARNLDPDELAYTLVGTPEYLPPEVLRGRGYSTSCDWWSLGITIYKMLNGHGPFFRATRAEIFAAIVEGRFEYPAHFDPVTRDLLRGLLNPNEKKRLGVKGGAEAIKEHPWFKDMDWSKLEREQVMPPFVPDPIDALYDKLEDRAAPEAVPESYKKLFTDF